VVAAAVTTVADQKPKRSIPATVAEWRRMQAWEIRLENAATLDHDGANAHAHRKAARVYRQCADAIERATCTWRLDDEAWKTSCRNAYQFNVGGPEDNGQRFCGYCGRRIKVQRGRR